MSIERELNKHSGGKCELSGVTEDLKVYQILPTRKGGLDESVLINATLIDQIENPEKMDINLWRCLNDNACGRAPSGSSSFLANVEQIAQSRITRPNVPRRR
jgi:hypothetical protein